MQRKPETQALPAEGSEMEPYAEMTLEEALQKLADTTDLLQNRDLPLEEALEAYQEGLSLVRYCTQRIDLAEKQVLVLNEEGGFSEF